jgi:hypothetical protein
MGMFDDVHCEADLPPGNPGLGREFQTKSLLCCLDQFTITKEGRLVLHAFRYQPAGEAMDGLPKMDRIPAPDIDTEFHGDILLTGRSGDGLVEYVARFTHGSLEWIRPWPEISEIQQSFLRP